MSELMQVAYIAARLISWLESFGLVRDIQKVSLSPNPQNYVQIQNVKHILIELKYFN